MICCHLQYLEGNSSEVPKKEAGNFNFVSIEHAQISALRVCLSFSEGKEQTDKGENALT